MEPSLANTPLFHRRGPLLTVLHVSHHHPKDHPGGAQGYAYELHRTMLRRGLADSYFLAGSLHEVNGFHSTTRFKSGSRDGREILIKIDRQGYDHFFQRTASKATIVEDFRGLLRSLSPNVVHFQHTSWLGMEMIREVRNTLPEAAIVYTLHEYIPICNRQGQMVTTDGGLCESASPSRCSNCFPAIDPSRFFLRERFIKAALEPVDLFVAPSRFLRDRYVGWGLTPEKIVFMENGRNLPLPLPDEQRSRRNRFGFFGQLNPFKGIDVLLAALIESSTDGGKRGRSAKARSLPQLTIHGAHLDIQSREFRKRVKTLKKAAGELVSDAGEYSPEDLPRLMHETDWVVVPSLWWENAPLVIQEAFHFGRPVICSDIGGMAERVRHGIDGLHFKVGDVHHLSATLKVAAQDCELWSRLQTGILPVPTTVEQIHRLLELYSDILTSRSLGEVRAG